MKEEKYLESLVQEAEIKKKKALHEKIGEKIKLVVKALGTSQYTFREYEDGGFVFGISPASDRAYIIKYNGFLNKIIQGKYEKFYSQEGKEIITYKGEDIWKSILYNAVKKAKNKIATDKKEAERKEKLKLDAKVNHIKTNFGIS